MDREAAGSAKPNHPDGQTPLQGAPIVPAEARAELLALKGGAAFLCTRPDGEILAGAKTGEGFYVNDTRHLSELRLTLDGAPPVLLSSVIESGQRAVVDQTNPSLRDRNRAPTPQETINLRRTLLLADRLYYRLRLRSYCRHPLSVPLALRIGADFADVFEVRTAAPPSSGALLEPLLEERRILFRYRGADGTLRETEVVPDPVPESATLNDHFSVTLSFPYNPQPGSVTELELQVRALGPRRRLSQPPSKGDPAGRRQRAAQQRLAREQRRWLNHCTGLETGNELVDRVLGASVRDLHALMMPAPGGQLPAAGVPWYVAPFGRDSLLTALQTLLLNPQIAKGTLQVLATLQGKADDPFRDEEPGKIPHELRKGELARLRRIPHTPYYGTVDATPLFVLLAALYYRWTVDRETVEQLLPALEAALRWIDRYGDKDGDGFVEYERRSPAGLLNQGWKDSDDALLHPDGSQPEGPIALVEVQGYVYAAKQEAATLFAQLGQQERALELRRQAARLKEAFNEAFWDEQEQYFALALDGRKRPVRTVTSNPGHCLLCGIVEPKKAERVAARLLAPDMFSGWGIRTVSTEMATYNPMSYHNGSVWPHDNALACAGLKRYGFQEEAVRVAKAIFDVAVASPNYRLPELICGFGRGEARSYVAYPVACSPQAWAAGAPLLLVEALLGLRPNAPKGTLQIEEPHLPGWLPAFDLHHLRVGAARVSLSFRRTSSGHTGFALLDQEGELGVTMAASPTPWSPRLSGPSRRPSSIR